MPMHSQLFQYTVSIINLLLPGIKLNFPFFHHLYLMNDFVYFQMTRTCIMSRTNLETRNTLHQVGNFHPL